MRTVMMSLTLTLVISACTPQGSFCDLAEDLRTTREVSAFIFDHDEPMARKLAVHNRLVMMCGSYKGAGI